MRGGMKPVKPIMGRRTRKTGRGTTPVAGPGRVRPVSAPLTDARKNAMKKKMGGI